RQDASRRDRAGAVDRARWTPRQRRRWTLMPVPTGIALMPGADHARYGSGPALNVIGGAGADRIDCRPQLVPNVVRQMREDPQQMLLMMEHDAFDPPGDFGCSGRIRSLPVAADDVGQYQQHRDGEIACGVDRPISG